MGAARWLRDQARGARGAVALTAGLGVSGGLLLVLQSWLLVNVADRVIFQRVPLSAVAGPLAAMLALFAARAAAAWAAELTGFAAAAGVKRGVRVRLYARLAARGPVALAGLKPGAAAAAAVDAVEALEDYFARYLPHLGVAALLPLLLLAIVFPLDPLSGGIMAATAAMLPVLMAVIGDGAERLNRRHWARLTAMSGRFADTIRGLPTLKMLGAASREARVVARLSEEHRGTSMAVMRVAFLSSLFLELFSAVSIALVAISLGLRLMAGSMHLKPAYFILLLAPEYYLPLRTLATWYHKRLAAIGAAEQILDLLDAPAPRRRPRGTARPTWSAVTVALREVAFSYEAGRRALSSVSLVAEPGETVALAGPSGAGKSTVMSLILGFIEPQRGLIEVNGTRLDRIEAEAWLRHVAWLPQRPHLFAGTVLDNIRLGRPEASMSEVERAARRAHAHDFIQALPRGYATPVGEGGAGLAGGEVQRVALARAFLKDAPLLLLDEAGAHLDTASARLVRRGIEELARGRTVLAIAHSLETVERADRIVLIDGGRTAATGTHEALLASSPLYRRLALLPGGER